MITQDIKLYANTIGNLIEEKKSLLVSDLYEMTNYSEIFIFLSLGWLARDNKVNFYLDTNGAFCVQINEPYYETTPSVSKKPYTDIYY